MTLSRRGLLQAALGGSAATAVDRLLVSPPAEAVGRPERRATPQIVPFYGRHQAGITTAPPTYLALAAFDLGTSSASAVRLVLRSWTEAAARMTLGEPAVAGKPGGASPPPDSGEAAGAGPQRLTVTFGFGPSLFAKLGMTNRRPAGLQPLPAMPGDRLDRRYCGGDVVVQACAETELVALHAVRQLLRLGAPVLVPRWMQTGFGIAARPPRVASTPRNLFGFKDGTANPVLASRVQQAVWIQPPDQPRWTHDGSFMAVRRVLTNLARWDRDTLDDQERAFGRFKLGGAPLTGGTEFTAPDFAARRNGKLVIPKGAHIRAAHPRAGEAPMLRRGCNFDEGLDAAGQLHAGQVFIAFVRDLPQQFVPVLSRVMSDHLTTRYTTHVGSAVFVIPPGVPKGGYVGQTLFG